MRRDSVTNEQWRAWAIRGNSRPISITRSDPTTVVRGAPVAKRKKDLGEPEVNGTAVVRGTSADLPAPEPPPTEKAQPVHTIRMRNVRAAIWANPRPDGSVWYAVTYSRSYKGEDGNWHS